MDNVAVILIVAVAVGFIVRHFYKGSKKGCGCGCEAPACSSDTGCSDQAATSELKDFKS